MSIVFCCCHVFPADPHQNCDVPTKSVSAEGENNPYVQNRFSFDLNETGNDDYETDK